MATVSHAYAWPFLEQAVVSVAQEHWLASPASARWSDKIPKTDLNHSMLDRVKGLHRRETTQLPEQVLLQIILELKGQFNKRVNTRAFPIFPRSQGITEFHAVSSPVVAERSSSFLNAVVTRTIMTNGRWSRNPLV